MAIQIITPEDLELFRIKLLQDLKDILTNTQKPADKKYLKGSEVRKLLVISPGTLQKLRIIGSLNPTKIGGTFYYNQEEIQKLLTSN